MPKVFDQQSDMTDACIESETDLTGVNWNSKRGYRLLSDSKDRVRQAEAQDIKHLLHDMKEQGKTFVAVRDELSRISWSPICMTVKHVYQRIWTEKLQFLRKKDWLNKEEGLLLSSKRNYHSNIEESKTDTTKLNELFWKLKYQNNSAVCFAEELKKTNEQIKSAYDIYDISLACREKTIFDLSNLSDEDAKRYCDYSVLASLLLERRLPNFNHSKTVDHTVMIDEYLSTIIQLHWNERRYKSRLIILQTVLTLRCLTEEQKELFTTYSKSYEKAIEVNEACYVYSFVHGYFHGREAEYPDKDVNDIREEFEQMLIQVDALFIKYFLLAITALHFGRECRYPILKPCIDFYDSYSQTNDAIIDQAIRLLRQQHINMSELRDLSPLQTMESINKSMPKFPKSVKRWYGRKNYLRIENVSVVNFPIYISKSDIKIIVKLIRQRFASDLDGQYELEKASNLAHKPLSSLVVYLSKDLRNVNEVQGQLLCGRQTIAIDQRDCYVRLPNVPENYQDLKNRIFNRLITETPKYAKWFRQIINEGGGSIDTDDDFVLFAHAKIVSECVRNLSTWMINLMCLDLIEDGLILIEGHDKAAAHRESKSSETSPWNLFFNEHSMIGGSYKNQESIASGKNLNQKEIEDQEAKIVMNWLCNSWLGNEEITMVDDVEETIVQDIRRNELADAERFGRSRIIDILHCRMYSLVRWVNVYREETVFLRSHSNSLKRTRRILGRMVFDDDPLSLSPDHTSESDNDLQFQMDLNEEIVQKSIEYFNRLLQSTKNNNDLQTFYQQKIQELRMTNKQRTIVSPMSFHTGGSH